MRLMIFVFIVVGVWIWDAYRNNGALMDAVSAIMFKL